jgi:hypothetical protein
MNNLTTLQPQINKPAENTAINLVLPTLVQQLTYPLDYITQEILADFIKKLAVYPTQYSTTDRDGLVVTKGLLIYNTTTNKLNFYNGTAWEVITSS